MAGEGAAESDSVAQPPIHLWSSLELMYGMQQTRVRATSQDLHFLICKVDRTTVLTSSGQLKA